MSDRKIREWARFRLIPESHKRQAGKGERTDYEFNDGSVERVTAIDAFLKDISFDKYELRNIFRKYPTQSDLNMLAEKIRALPFHEFLDFLRKRNVRISGTKQLERFLGLSKSPKTS